MAKGTVTQINPPGIQYGEIRGNDGKTYQFIIPWSAAKNLEEGQEVDFDPDQSDSGLAAKNVK